MRGTSIDIFAVAASCAVLFAGCEWTSSGGDSSWSGNYDNMNFSGTYRTGVISVSTTTTTPVDVSVSEKVGSYSPASTGYSGKLHGGVVVGSLGISAGAFTFSDNGSGVLVGLPNTQSAGTINYSSGAWSINVPGGFADSGSIIATYSYNSTSVTGGSNGTTSITAVTVSQVGQNLTMRFSNGVTMAGQFGSVNETPTGYNAQFEVKSDGNRFVGTLDSTTGTKVIDGTWSSGKTNYDVHGVGGASTSRATVAE